MSQKLLDYITTIDIDKVNTVHFDMDGVLFDFDTQFQKYSGISVVQALREDTFDVYKEVMFMDPQFFATMPLIKEGVDLLMYFVQRGKDVQILSSMGSKTKHHQKVSNGKQLSVTCAQEDGLLPTNMVVNIVPGSKVKAMYARTDSLLVDDRLKALEPYKEAGGQVIHFKQ